MKRIFRVDGMRCAACQAHVQTAVSNLNGVNKVDVNLLSKEMTVDCDETKLQPADIILAVSRLGFKAALQETAADENTPAEEMKQEAAVLLKRILISLIFLIPLTVIAMVWHGNTASALIQLILLVPILILNRSYFTSGFNRLFRGTPNMDSLIAVGSGAGVVYSLGVLFLMFRGADRSDLYFEAAGMIPVLITIGKYLECKSKGRTGDAIAKLVALTPKTAFVERDGNEQEISVSEIRIGDIVILRAGSAAAVDGIVTAGEGSVDQAAVTGESVPVEKTIGEKIISGSICTDGYLKFRAEKVGRETTLAQVIALVKEASNSKAPISRLADKVSAVFVPTVIGIAVITFIAWMILDGSASKAIGAAIAVLVISCPCALGLATPVAIMVGTGRAAELGVLFKNAESLENLHKINVAVFDKTGTLTTGEPAVTDIIPAAGKTDDELLALAAGLEHFSQHPFARTICDLAKAKGINALTAERFEAVAGKGVRAQINGKVIGAGNAAFLQTHQIAADDTALKTAQELADHGKTPLFFISDGKIAGIIALADTIRTGTAQALAELKTMSVRTVMLTGDNSRTAQALGKQAGIDEIVADVLPAEKESVIRKIQDDGKRAAMVGDGINDAPALARADVGIAIGAGTEIALDAADVVLSENDPRGVVRAIRLSRAVIGNIKMNLFWAFFYNALGIPLAAGLFYPLLGWQLPPMFGAMAMSLSSFCVVTNALRLRFFR